MFMRCKQTNILGMTIIELIVSIAIFGILATTIISNFRSGERSSSVRQASRLTESLLRRAQTMTLTGSVLGNGDFPDGGYGVRFDKSQPGKIILFADKNRNYIYDTGESMNEDILFPGGATFSLSENLDVVFSATDNGNALFNGVNTPGSKTISFTGINTTQTNTITIYRLSGQIRVE